MTGTRTPARQRDWIAPLLVAVVGALAAHGLAVRAGFAWDDRHTVVTNPAMQSIRGLLRSFTMDDWAGYGLQARGLYRPLTTVSLFVDRLVFGDAAAAHHASSIALHAWTAFALALVARAWGVRTSVALTTCALFAVHPAFTEAVDWISARPDVLSTALFAGALLAVSWRRPIMAGVLAGLAPFAKETGLAAVPAIALAAVLTAKGSRRNAAGACVAMGLAVAYLFSRRLAGVSGATLQQVAEHASAGVFRRWGDTSAQVVAALAWPLPLDVTRRVHPLGAIGWVHGLLAVGAALLAAAWPGPRRPLRAALAVAAAGPVALITVYDAGLSERYLYLPGFALLLGIAAAVETVASQAEMTVRARRLGIAVGVALVVFAIPASVSRARQWADPVALFGSAVAADPTNPRAYQMLGAELYRSGRREDAARAWEQGVALGGGTETLSNLCAVHREMGDPARALRECDAAVALTPTDPRARYHRALAYLSAGRNADAMRDLEEVLATTPGYAPAQRLLAQLAPPTPPAPAMPEQGDR